MNLTPLVLAGLLAAGVVVAGDEHVLKLAKTLHGGGPDCPLAGVADVAPLAVLHEAIGRMDLDESRSAGLHERMEPLARSVHQNVAQVVAARDAQVRAVFAIPFDDTALQSTSQDVAAAEQALVGAVAGLHATLRASLSEAERSAFDAARDAALVETEKRHAELRQALESGQVGPQFHHGR